MLLSIEQAVSKRILKLTAPTWQLSSGLVGYWPLLLPVLLLIPALSAFPYPSPAAQFSDLVITHYPNAVFLRRAVLEWHSLPLWSPSILSGYPFAANPLSGLWYPPGWLALLFPLPLGFNLLVLGHLVWGGLGLYTLLRREGLARPAAVLGGAAFAALPKLFAHYGAGHLTLLYAVPWTPWLLAAGARDPSAWRRQTAIPPGLVLALIFLADVRWAAYAGLLWAGFSLFRSSGRAQDMPDGRNTRWFSGVLAYLAGQTLLAAFLAAPLGLPLLEYTRNSTRTALQPQDVLAFSLPPSRLLGMVYPDFGGFHEWVLYPGAVVLLLSLLAIVWSRGLPGACFWLAAAALAILFSLGSFLPGLENLIRLPGADLLRVPPRALFLAGIALAAAAAHAMDALLNADWVASHQAVFRRRAVWVLFGVPAFAAAFSAGLWVILGSVTLPFIWGAAALLLSAGWVLLRLVGRIPTGAWAAGLLTLAMFDLGAMDRTLFSPRPAAQVLAEGRPLAERLALLPGGFRVYSPSYSLPQQTAAQYGLELADGVDPLQLSAYVEFMQPASGIPVEGYSVTLPPFGVSRNASGDHTGSAGVSAANAGYRPDPARLGLLNVAYVASEFPLQVEGLDPIDREGSTYLYANRLARPRLWVQTVDPPAGQAASKAGITLWSPNRIEVSIDGPIEKTGEEPLELLVLSELAYPGWMAWIDGRQVEIETFEGLLRSIRLPTGSRHVTICFRPLTVYAGLACCFLGVVWMLFAGASRRLRGEKPIALAS